MYIQRSAFLSGTRYPAVACVRGGTRTIAALVWKKADVELRTSNIVALRTGEP